LTVSHLEITNLRSLSHLPPYFDHHATTPVDPRVLETMLPFFSIEFGNASSISHVYGSQAKKAVDRARSQIATSLNTKPRSIVFTSGATEANNLAIKGLLRPAMKAGERTHVITTQAEHRAVLDPIKRLTRSGVSATVLPVDEFGCVSVEQLKQAITPDTKLVSVMWANNEVGSINPIAEIAQLCHDRNIVFHVDAVQAFGKIPIDLAEVAIDLLSITAHKTYGPKGVGALVVQRNSKAVRLEPLLDGGGHEHRMRSGTLAVPLIAGFGEACQLADEELNVEGPRLRALRDSLWQNLNRSTSGLILNGHPSHRLAGNLNFSVPDLDGEVLMNSMTKIAVSSGSACTSADPEPSHVLRAIGRTDQETRASLRFGIGRFNTEDEINFASSFVSETIARVRSS
jgi:cysteine desulfurase